MASNENLSSLRRAVDEYRAAEADPKCAPEREHYLAASLCLQAERVLASFEKEHDVKQ